MMQIAKAQSTGDEEVKNITIEISDECPSFCDIPPANNWVERSENFFMEQARDLEEALYNSLPGGTYDRLLGLMLKRRASHFIVSFAG